MSSNRITTRFFLLFLFAAGEAAALVGTQAFAQQGKTPASVGANSTGSVKQGDPGLLFQRGQVALTQGKLDEAERDFQQVVAIDPRSGGAYANLGVVHMRRKQWEQALTMLNKAEKLMPQVAGIRLNIGLAYYRQNQFLKAIPAFESVVRDEPNALQPRYLLGLCYFFAERWADAAATLEPLWEQESNQLPYLYVVSNAAHRAGKKDLDQRATERLIQLGNGTPEYKLFVGKYHLNQQHYDLALAQFQEAAGANPKLPFVHFNLGLTYLKKLEYEKARDEFLKDAAIEPDLALNYSQLGEVYWLMQQDADAEKSYREALRRDGRLVDSRLGLAKIYQRQEKYSLALVEADAAVKLDPERSDAHYVRGQILQHLGRKEEGRKELEAAQKRIEAAGAKPAGAENVPSPELLQEPQ